MYLLYFNNLVKSQNRLGNIMNAFGPRGEKLSDESYQLSWMPNVLRMVYFVFLRHSYNIQSMPAMDNYRQQQDAIIVNNKSDQDH